MNSGMPIDPNFPLAPGSETGFAPSPYMVHPAMMGEPFMPAPPGMAQPGMPPGMQQPMTPQLATGQDGNMVGLDVSFMTLQSILDVLKNGVYIKQKMDLLEVVTGLNMANTYYVFELTPTGEAFRTLIFECKETSNFVDRNCGGGGCRAIDLVLLKAGSGMDRQVVLKMTKPCQCTCCCASRPEMKVFMTENGQDTYLGKVCEPWTCCHHSYEVFDATDSRRITLEANCCQCGFFCKCPCEACETIKLDVTTGESHTKARPVFKKGSGNCVKNAVSTVDYFSVPFPANSSWQDKALMLAAVLMIDYLKFEEQPDNKRHREMNNPVRTHRP